METPSQPDPVAPSAEQIDTSHGVTLWSCVIKCADEEERAAVGAYQGNNPLALARPWMSPLDAAVHRIRLRHAFPMLTALIQAADYHLGDDIVFGEITPTPILLAALTGITSRTTVYQQVDLLAKEGYLYYEPAPHHLIPTFIRLFARNVITGDLVFGPDESWQRDFVRLVIPQTPLYSTRARGVNFDVIRLAEKRSMAEIKDKVVAAPILMPELPFAPTPAPLLPGNRVLVEALAQVDPVLYRVWTGAPPDLGFAASTDNGSHQELMTSLWQGGKEVLVGPETMAPGVNAIPWHQVLTSRAKDTMAYETSSVMPPDRSQKTGASGALAPSATRRLPPPSPPPAASARYLRPFSQRLRQLGQEQLAALHRQRGPRLSTEARAALPPTLARCVEDYERLIGVPFCESDLPPLRRAVDHHPVEFVRGQIRYCAREPRYNPGFYVVRDGMETILKSVEAAWASRIKPSPGPRPWSPRAKRGAPPPAPSPSPVQAAAPTHEAPSPNPAPGKAPGWLV